MPPPHPSSDETGQQESLPNLDPVLQEGSSSSRKKSPKGGKKKKRKDGSPTDEDAAKAGKGGDAMEGGSDKKLYVAMDHQYVPHVGHDPILLSSLLTLLLSGHNLLRVSSRSFTKLKLSSRLLLLR